MKARFTIRLKRHIIVLVALMGALMTATAQDTIAVAQDTTSVVQDTIAAVRKAPQRKKVALVLSGGGAKGTAHIGVLKVLERAGIPIDIITGTSMGSLVGGIYACGHRANEIDSVVRQLDWSLLLSDRNDLKHQSLREREKQNTYVISKELTFGKTVKRRGGGFISGKNVVALIDAYTAPYHDSIDFNQLPIPFACVATDVVDYSEQVFHSGIIGQAMRASMSIPGVFSPVRTGDRVLVDGGLTNNFPTDIARQMGADIVIGVDVQSELKGASELTSASTILLQIVDHNCKHKYEENLALTDIHILVNTKGYSSASFSEAAVDTLIRRGEEAAMEHWDEFVKLREEIGVSGVKVQDSSDNAQVPAPVKVEFVGNEKPQKTINVGARFDSEEMVALQANAEVPIRAKVPMNAELTIRLGKRIKAQVDWSVHPSSIFQPGVSYAFTSNDIDFYEYGDRIYSMTFNQHAVKLKLLNFNVRNFNVSIGANWDYYDFHTVLSDHEAIRDNLDDGDVNDKGYVNYEARADYSSENDWYFPTRGTSIHARFVYHTDNCVKLNNDVGLREYVLLARSTFPITRKLSIQPMFYARALYYKADAPLVLGNMMGGEWRSHYFVQQMPFAGVGNLELAWDKLTSLQLQAQYNVTPNSILLFKVAAAQDSPEVKDLLKHKTMLGASASYYLNTMFGPLGGSIGYSSLTKKFYYYINLGFVF